MPKKTIFNWQWLNWVDEIFKKDIVQLKMLDLNG